jgi:hypothetical protein
MTFICLLNINIHSPITINGLLYTSSIIIGSLVAIALLCNNIIDIIGGGLPNANIILFILVSTVKDF